MIFIGCRGEAVVNSSSRVYSQHTGRPVSSVASATQVLGDHLLLAAEAAADPHAEHPQLVGPQVEQVRQLDLGRSTATASWCAR